MPIVPKITLKEEQEEKERLIQVEKDKKSLRKFNKGLTKKTFFQADLLYTQQSQDYHDKVNKCFNLRIKNLNKKKLREKEKWSNVYDENKNYLLNKKGYKELLNDIGSSNNRITMVKRGLSVFDHGQMRSQLLSNANAPVISEEML